METITKSTYRRYLEADRAYDEAYRDALALERVPLATAAMKGKTWERVEALRRTAAELKVLADAEFNTALDAEIAAEEAVIAQAGADAVAIAERILAEARKVSERNARA